jgi:hypothetical protein
MKTRLTIWMAGLTGLALAGVLAAQAQEGSRAGGDQGNRREAAGAGGERAGGQDHVMLIGHGLAMAIEGSTLQALASRSGGMAMAAGGAGAGRGGGGTGASGTLRR